MSNFPHKLVAALALLVSPIVHAQDFDTRTHIVANPRNAAIAAAQAALDAHDFPKAVTLLTPLAEADPKDAKLLYDLGSAQDALDQSAPAETSYKAAIAADPKLLEAHLALGLLLARAGRMDDARTELVAASIIPEGDHLLKARAFRTLARIDQGARPEDARDELLAALKLSPETPEDTIFAAEFAASVRSDTDAAEAALRKLLTAQPHAPGPTAALARLLTQQKRNDEAETLLHDSLQANPGDLVLTTQLATLYNAEGRPANALPLVATLHAQHLDDLNLTHLLASLYAQTGDYAHAEPLYAALLTQAPSGSPPDPMLLDARGDALIHLKRFAEAQQVLTQAVAQPSQFPTPADLGHAAERLAFASSENNDSSESLQALTIRATVLPPSPGALFLEAIAQDKLHHVKQAQQAYKKFLQSSNGALPDEEFEAKHRLTALEHMK